MERYASAAANQMVQISTRTCIYGMSTVYTRVSSTCISDTQRAHAYILERERERAREREREREREYPFLGDSLKNIHAQQIGMAASLKR
jgi:hypothetical protein